MNEAAKDIVRKLKSHGHEAVFAGGCVRDMLLNIPANDIDIATSATPDQVESIFNKTIPVGKQFGIIVVIQNNMEFEVATFRKDSKESDGRRPNSVEFSSMKEDANRRDLTINGMFWDPIEEKLLDFVGGEKDLKDKKIRFIGNVQDRIDEDRLRMLRAVRFTTRFNFDIDEETKEVIKENAHNILDISAERIKAELDKMLKGNKPSKSFELLREVGLLEFILPEVHALWNQDQSLKWHSEGAIFENGKLVKLGTVGHHTMLVLDNTRKHTDNLSTLWAALLHDIGKPSTAGVSKEGNINNHGHDKVGAEMADRVMINMKASTSEKKAAVAIVNDHMRAHSVQDMKKSKLRRFIAQDHFNELMIMSNADDESSIPENKNEDDRKNNNSEFLKGFISRLKEDNEIELPKPFINGNDLIKMGLKSGPKFREILDFVSNAQLDGDVNSREEALVIANSFI